MSAVPRPTQPGIIPHFVYDLKDLSISVMVAMCTKQRTYTSHGVYVAAAGPAVVTPGERAFLGGREKREGGGGRGRMGVKGSCHCGDVQQELLHMFGWRRGSGQGYFGLS